MLLSCNECEYKIKHYNAYNIRSGKNNEQTITLKQEEKEKKRRK